MKLTKRRVILGVIVIGAAVALSPYITLAGITGYGTLRERLHRIPFNPSAWQDAALVNGEDPVRIRMVDDLIKSRRLDGKSRPEVEKLLGSPTNNGYFKGTDFVYWLGPERGFISIDSEWLLVNFDTKGTVREYHIARD